MEYKIFAMAMVFEKRSAYNFYGVTTPSIMGRTEIGSKSISIFPSVKAKIS